jgi:hypothetical protein
LREDSGKNSRNVLGLVESWKHNASDRSCHLFQLWAGKLVWRNSFREVRFETGRSSSVKQTHRLRDSRMDPSLRNALSLCKSRRDGVQDSVERFARGRQFSLYGFGCVLQV